jgi:hypothetical protein
MATFKILYEECIKVASLCVDYRARFWDFRRTKVTPKGSLSSSSFLGTVIDIGDLVEGLRKRANGALSSSSRRAGADAGDFLIL